MWLPLIIMGIFLASFAFLYNQGLWSNALTLINTVTAGLIAFNYFEPLAAWLDKNMPEYTYVWDFLSLWLIFALTFSLFRTITDKLSLVRVKFKRPVDTAGSVILALWISAVVTEISLASLHTAPLARNFLDGAFQKTPDTKMIFGLGPDRAWLAYMHKASQGAYSKMTPNQFDPNGAYIRRYGQRRSDYEKQINFSVPAGS